MIYMVVYPFTDVRKWVHPFELPNGWIQGHTNVTENGNQFIF